MLALLPRIRNLLGYVGRFGNCFAADIEDDNADLEAVIGSNAVWINTGDKHPIALVAGLLAPHAFADDRGQVLEQSLVQRRAPRRVGAQVLGLVELALALRIDIVAESRRPRRGSAGR